MNGKKKERKISNVNKCKTYVMQSRYGDGRSAYPGYEPLSRPIAYGLTPTAAP